MRAVVAAGLLLAAAPLVFAQPSPGAKPVVLASDDDCAIIVEIGKAKLGWGATPPAYALYPEFDLPGGGVYREDCPWKALGVADPVIGTPESQKGFFVSRPVYEGTRATAEFQMSMRPPPGERRAFIEADTCTLEKRDGHWHLIECKLKFIT